MQCDLQQPDAEEGRCEVSVANSKGNKKHRKRIAAKKRRMKLARQLSVKKQIGVGITSPYPTTHCLDGMGDTVWSLPLPEGGAK